MLMRHNTSRQNGSEYNAEGANVDSDSEIHELEGKSRKASTRASYKVVSKVSHKGEETLFDGVFHNPNPTIMVV